MRALYLYSIDYFRKVNWMLLSFLVLIINVKTPVKVFALIIFISLNRKFLFDKINLTQRFIWFYFGMIIITMINLFLNISSLSTNYLVAVAVGITFWLMCAAAAYLNIFFVLKTDTSKLHNTVTLFFILNAVITIVQLLLIIWDAGAINPFMYQGMYQKYFISTGDLIKGLSFDVSTTNAILNVFGVFYFLYRNKMHLALLCMAILLLTASNFINVTLVFVFAFSLLFKSNWNQKSIILVCFSLLVIFTVKISPQNNNYTTEAYKKFFNAKSLDRNDVPDSKKTDPIQIIDEKRKKIALLYLDSLLTQNTKRLYSEEENKIQKENIIATGASKPFIPKPSIHTEPFQRRRDTTFSQRSLLEFGINNINSFDTSMHQIKSWHLPGKFIAMQQTIDFFNTHPLKIVTGIGIGNFSSKLAFRTTGLKIGGSYPRKWVYINPYFLNNHLNIYLSYFSKDAQLHSLINSPNNVYDQIIAEYGLAGMFCLVGFYMLFFIRRIKSLTYGIPLLLFFTIVLGIEYWFEQLSIVILFELLMLINIKETKKNA